MPRPLVVVLVQVLVSGCHLVIPHAPAPARDAARERPPLDLARDLVVGAESATPDARPDRARDLRKPDLAPAQGTSCQNAAKTAWFSASAPPTPGATLTLAVCIKDVASGPTWVMAGVKSKLADGKGSCCTGCYKAHVNTTVPGCPSGMQFAWQVAGVQVPKAAGPYAFSLLKDCVGDDCTLASCTEVAWCKP